MQEMDAKKSNKPTFETPLNKIQLPLSDNNLNVCLMMIGLFFPIQNHHIRILEIVKEHLTRVCKYNVIGGFIIPTHNANLKNIVGGMSASAAKRLKMCELAIEDSSWINIDPFLLMQPKKLPVSHYKQHLEKLLNSNINNQDEKENSREQVVKILPVIEFDSHLSGEWSSEREPFVLIHTTSLLQEREIIKEKFKSHGDGLIFVQYEETLHKIDFAMLTEMIVYGKSVDTYLNPNVIDYIRKDESIMKIFITLLKEKQSKSDNEEPLKNNSINIMTKEQYLTEYGVRLYIDPEDLDKLLDFPYQTVPIDNLQPEYSDGKLWSLGKGVAATVWAMKMDNIPVAVKFFNLSSEKTRRLQNVRLELRALMRIKHKNVIKCFGAGVVGNAIYIVLERAAPLSAWSFSKQNIDEWSGKGYSLRWIKGWADLSEGLQAMSDAGILHRDLQLDNILIFNEGPQEERKEANDRHSKSKEETTEIHQGDKLTFKVTDFGVSSLEEDKDKITRGSIRHYAPEALQDKANYTSASDVYSFAMVIWEMIHGKRIWANLLMPEVIKKVEQGERPPFEVPCHEKILSVLNLCWAQKPEERPSFGEVSKLLNQVHIELST